MKRLTLFGRSMARLIAAVMLLASLPLGVAQADMVTTAEVIDQVTADQGRLYVMEFLAREDVRQRLEAMGIDADEAAARADSLTDAEIMQIAGQIEELPAGQSAAGTIIGVALVIFLVLLVTDLLGFTNVFPFVRAQT